MNEDWQFYKSSIHSLYDQNFLKLKNYLKSQVKYNIITHIII